MNWTPLRSIPLLLTICACGGAATPPADSPENSDESSSTSSKGDKGEDESSLGGSSQRAHAADPTVPVTVKDDDAVKKKDAPCAGTNIQDLLALASQDSCVTNDPQAEVNRREVKDVLEVKVTTDSPKVAPGGTVKVTVALHNKGKQPLPLDLKVDPLPRVLFEVSTPKGQRADKPTGAEPPLPPEVSSAPTPDARIARVLLAPQGSASINVSWDAVKYKWASKDKAKGAVPGRGYPREAAGPLAKGKYVLRVVLPLVGLSEGADHEYSQPKADIEVAQ
ncbi:MAG TPA: hypothetical protein VKU41_22390 [Polyangiaceae bacterium]|nr:hypothetical protein [Polyangiaceae bacterium]